MKKLQKKTGKRIIGGKDFYFTGGYETKCEARSAAKEFRKEHGYNHQYRVRKVPDERGSFWGFYTR